MFLWNIVDNNKYIYCNHIDTLEHKIFYCVEYNFFWKGVFTWTKDNLESCFKFTIFDVIFGIPHKEENIDLFNFIILIGKWYINKIRTRNQPLLLNNFDMIICNKTINLQNLHNWEMTLSILL